MFTKILIANRGEIAVRIMATCREMGIRTVAVYSEADRDALHVREADEAYAIGPAPAAQSYLRIHAIVEVAKKSGAQAIHPGSGILAENTALVEACEDAGVVFIGPPPSAMRLMGSKIAAKQLAVSVNVPVIPGYNGESQDDVILRQEAEHIGFPLLIKASSGGGGKGMREVHRAADFSEELAGARREALAAFGDGTVFLERLIQQPRHVEIQVLGDTFGNLIHLGERECSIQRRQQKIVEESPSVALTPALRAGMGAAAVRIARAAGYINAGTIEFILDADGNFYFLEMNTRLQVEHAVTELVTGIDLVRHQLLIAVGQPLQLTQDKISPRGHAIEMRLYAEDRAAAIERIQRALEQTAVFGVKTNAPLLYSIATHPAFEEGRTYTSFLAEHALIGNNTGQQHLPGEVLVAGALSEIAGDVRMNSDGHAQPSNSATSSPWSTLGPWRMIGEARRAIFSYQGKEYSVAFRPTKNGSGEWSVQVDNQPAENITCVFGNDDLVLLRRSAEQVQTYVQHAGNETQVSLHGRMYRLEERQPPNVDTAVRESNPAHAQKVLTAPMAGTIVKVQVHEGDSVEQRQVLVILSAMKMEHTIVAPYAGKVRRVHYQEGAVVKGRAALVEME